MRFFQWNLMLVLFFLTDIKSQVSPRIATCCNTTTCLQELMQERSTRLDDTHYDPPLTYDIDFSGINVTLRMTNNTIHNLRREIIFNVGWSFSGNDTLITYLNWNPEFVHTANYMAIGSIQGLPGSNNYIMPINETGTATVVFPNLTYSHNVKLTTVNRNGVDVWKVVSTEMLGDFLSGHVDFVNINGSDDRRTNVLSEINNIFPQIINSIRPQITRQFGFLYNNLVRSILDDQPTDELICSMPHH